MHSEVQKDWDNLRFLTSPSLAVARYVACIAVVFGEIIGVFTCSTIPQNATCGTLGNGACGFVFIGTALAVIEIILIMAPDMLVGMIIAQISEDRIVGRPAQSRVNLKVFQVVVGAGCACFILQFMALVVALVFSFTTPQTPECLTSDALLAFVLALSTRIVSSAGFTIVWVSWFSKIRKYRKVHAA